MTEMSERPELAAEIEAWQYNHWSGWYKPGCGNNSEAEIRADERRRWAAEFAAAAEWHRQRAEHRGPGPIEQSIADGSRGVAEGFQLAANQLREQDMVDVEHVVIEGGSADRRQCPEGLLFSGGVLRRCVRVGGHDGLHRNGEQEWELPLSSAEGVECPW